ncbi:MAG: SpoIIE family protein phosphatase [Anaerolineales bacterium]|nr:SpoIIE family protein phosphatase [Anaerolineales bacterium]
MKPEIEVLEDLRTLNRIAETLNRAKDVNSALDTALAALIPLMGLQTGWISLLEPETGQFHLASHLNLPDELHPDNPQIWKGSCTCQDLARSNKLDRAYSEVRCSRLASLQQQSPRDLRVHASTPLLAGEQLLGILNVAAPDWSFFDTRSLSLLSNVGQQIGVALERARLFDRLRDKRNHEQEALLDFSRKLLSRFDLKEMTNFLTNEIIQLLDADACSLLLPTEDGSELEFAAAHGWWNDPVALKRRIPFQAGSGPEWVMKNQAVLLITDLDEDNSTYWSSNWLEAENFRAHAVVPLMVEDRAIGALVINNREPRLLTEDELRLLRLMSLQAALAIDSARLLVERTRKQQLEKELAIGQEIQYSLLPALLPSIPGYSFSLLYKPAREVGGDFYDFCQSADADRGLCIFIGDVSGKGIPAAMFMAMSRTHVRSSMISGRKPALALTHANEMILNDSRDGLFLSALAALLNPRTHQLTYSNAGHDRPLVLRKSTGKTEMLVSRGIILGAFEDIELEEKQTDLHQGDMLILYTDGLKDALSEDGQPFGLEGLTTALEEGLALDPDGMVAAIEAALKAHTGHAPQTDDLTLLILQRT